MPQQAELSIALVDEGILQLTDYKTPDPYNFFYGKKADNISDYDLYSLLLPEYEQEKIGADSSPSSGVKKNAAFDPKKHLNPISAKRVKSIVLWSGAVITDTEGRAKAEFEVPEFTGNLRIMVVAVGKKEFGNVGRDLKVTEPVIINATIPRFLSAGDIPCVNVSVFNNTGSSGTFYVSAFALEEDYPETAYPKKTLSIANGAEGSVDLTTVSYTHLTLPTKRIV